MKTLALLFIGLFVLSSQSYGLETQKFKLVEGTYTYDDRVTWLHPLNEDNIYHYTVFPANEAVADSIQALEPGNDYECDSKFHYVANQPGTAFIYVSVFSLENCKKIE